jgi:hypothetical protein
LACAGSVAVQEDDDLIAIRLANLPARIAISEPGRSPNIARDLYHRIEWRRETA